MFIDPGALILIVVIAMGIGGALAGVISALRLVNRRLDELEAVLAKRRHTYATTNGIEDATAVAINIALEEQAQAEWRLIRLGQLRKILGEVREGPLAYDGEQPAQRPPRPDGRGKR